MTNTIEDILRHSGVMGTNIADLDLTEIPEGEMAQAGVKGMKWGIRKDRGHEGERAKTKKIDKLDRKYKKRMQTTAGFIQVQNAIAERINPMIALLNNKTEYANADMTDPANSRLAKKYYAEYGTLLQRALDGAMEEIGTNASGTQRLVLSVEGEGLYTNWRGDLKDIQHAADSIESLLFTPVFNDRGLIVDLKIEELALDSDEDEMKHYGVLGQKWGVRRSENQLRRARGDISEDYVVSRKNKKKPIPSLSNAQLKALNERLQLERTNNDLQSRSALAKIKKGTAVAGTILAVGTTLTAAYNFTQTPIGKVMFSAFKKDKTNQDWLF